MTAALDVIKTSLRILQVVDQNQPVQAFDLQNGIMALNQTLSHLATQYNHLWLNQLCIVLCRASQPSYDIGVGGQYVVEQSKLLTPTVAANAIAGATSITLSAASGIAAGYTIAVFNNNQQAFYTTVSGTPVGATVTLSAPLPDDVASGNQVYAFESTVERPLRITNAQFADAINISEIPIEQFSRNTYFDQPVKLTTGSCSNWYYDPQLSTGVLYLWPTPYSDTNVVRFTAQRPFKVVEETIDEVDLPEEWISALCYKTAEYLLDQYSVPADRQQMIMAKSKQYIDDCLAFDNDASPIKVELKRW